MDLEELVPQHEIVTDNYFVEKRRFNTLMVSGIALSILLYPFLGSVLIPPSLDFTWRLILSRFIIWAIVGVMFLYASKGEMQKMLLWPEAHYKTSFYIKWIFLLYLMTMGVGVIARIPYWLGYHENSAMVLKVLQATHNNPTLLIFIAITAGITEEYIFRGYILSRLTLLVKNKHVAVIISALLFALVHLAYRTYIELIFAFGIGLVLGYHYQKYRSLTTVIAVHFLIDVIALGFGRLH